MSTGGPEKGKYEKAVSMTSLDKVLDAARVVAENWAGNHAANLRDALAAFDASEPRYWQCDTCGRIFYQEMSGCFNAQGDDDCDGHINRLYARSRHE